MLAGLDLALMLTATKLEIKIDSQLIVGQIQQEYKANDERMTRYLTMVEEHLKKLDEWIIRWVAQDVNAKVDALAMIAATLPINGTIVLPIYLKVSPSITLRPVCSIGQTNSGWMFNIIKYLQIGDVPEDEKQSHNLRIQVAHFTLINDQLYKRSFGGPYLKCLRQPKAKYVLAKLHEGVCGNHPKE